MLSKSLNGASVKVGLGIALFLVAALEGCRGQTSEDPPVHLNLNMDFQTHFKPQEENTFFQDGRSNRPLVPGTVARGFLNEDDHMYRGKVGSDFSKNLPMPLSRELVSRGQERFQIYCTLCHGATGAGDGMIIKRGMLRPPSFHDDRIVQMPVGEIYEAINNGVRGNMPAYNYAIPVQDRWAIVAYVRALQISRRASLEQIPADIAESKGWKAR